MIPFLTVLRIGLTLKLSVPPKSAGREYESNLKFNVKKVLTIKTNIP
jgi:hypothetical protein